MSSTGVDSSGLGPSGPRERTWTDRVDALIQAAADVRMGPPTIPDYDNITDAYRLLRTQFVAEMGQAMRGARAWWEAMLENEMSRGVDRTTAEREVRRRNTVGVVADRRVIAVLRSHWLACEELNASTEPNRAVLPEELLLRSLVGTSDEDVARFLSALPYWPLGVDADGRWT